MMKIGWMFKILQDPKYLIPLTSVPTVCLVMSCKEFGTGFKVPEAC